jgi:NADP-dependent 3-hydroxy acid dehydrogenase YdfG
VSRLEGALVIVTGAGSGIGRATAEAMGRQGAKVLAIGRTRENLTTLHPAAARIAAVDVNDERGIAEAVRTAEAECGPVAVLVNAAGVMALSRVDDADPERFQEAFDTNCVGLLRLCRLVLPGMRERRTGTIVNIGSTAGKTMVENHTVYCATKHAVHALTEGLRRENLTAGVRILLAAPGLTDTGLLRASTAPDLVSDYLDGKAAIGAMEPAVVADAIVAMCELPDEISVRELVLAPTRQEM